MGPLVWTIAMVMPMLSSLGEIVKEKENGIRDLLQISGMMPFSYWAGNFLTIFCYSLITMYVTFSNNMFVFVSIKICLYLYIDLLFISIYLINFSWICVSFMLGVTIMTPLSVPVYASLSYCLVLSLSAAGMAFGFAVFKFEYYALPAFLFSIATAVGGLFVAQDPLLSVSAKLAFAFFLPPTGLAIGIFIIEDWFFKFGEDTPLDMNYAFNYGNRVLPSMNNLQGTLIGSAIFYMFICYGMPFDWVFHSDPSITENIISSSEELNYPCAREASDGFDGEKVLLDVKNISHVYPDGTHAVKNISFQVRSGEILSFLGLWFSKKKISADLRLCYQYFHM